MGHRPHLCLLLENKFYFFQVSFGTDPVSRVDALVFDEGWRIVELDGQGHDHARDAEREIALNTPTKRITTEQLVATIQHFLAEEERKAA